MTDPTSTALPEILQDPTPLLDLPLLARRGGVGRVLVKDESCRALGNFKSLGGTYAGIRALTRAGSGDRRRLICASDGNHGLAVAAAARQTGAEARIYLHEGVSSERAGRIHALGGEIAWVRGTYDDAVLEAAGAARRGEGLLVADTSDAPDDPVIEDVMAGYRVLADEIAAQVAQMGGAVPTHLFVQAGVGGLAAALAGGLADKGLVPRIIVVEPETAACVGQALRTGRPERLAGDLATVAEMLACGIASVPALEILRRHEAAAMTVDEARLAWAPRILRSAGGPRTTPSGAAGLAGFLTLDGTHRETFALDCRASVLLTATEGV